ncbi:MAG TPA: glycosyltransferase, partial [Hanamia sp.]
MQPKISVIIVVFNGAKTLTQAIESVLRQTYKNVELIVVDGGSTDGTLDILRKYESKNFIWKSEPDKGIY